MKKERNEETSQELKKVKSAEKDEQKFDIVFDMDDEWYGSDIEVDIG